MTETPPSDSYAWRSSADTRDQDRLADLRARSRADYERDRWSRLTS